MRRLALVLALAGCAGRGYEGVSTCEPCDIGDVAGAGVACTGTVDDCVSDGHGKCLVDVGLVDTLNGDGSFTDTFGDDAGTWAERPGYLVVTYDGATSDVLQLYENSATCPGGAQ